MHFTRLSAQAVQAGLLESDGLVGLQDLYATLLQQLKQHHPQHLASTRTFLMCLLRRLRALNWDDLDGWGVSVETVDFVVQNLPGLLLPTRVGMFQCVDLAHESLRDFFINQKSRVIRSRLQNSHRMGGAHLQRVGELKLQTEQGREWARTHFYRLYRWSLLCQDTTVLEWVVRNKELQKKRIDVCQATRGLPQDSTRSSPFSTCGPSACAFWLKISNVPICAMNGPGRSTVEDSPTSICSDANERGRLDKAVSLFDELVNQERQKTVPQWSAAAYNRRSEIRFACSKLRPLWKTAEVPEHFTDLVEDMGREDLRPQLPGGHRMNRRSQRSGQSGRRYSQPGHRPGHVHRLAEDGNTRFSREQAWCHLQLAGLRRRSLPTTRLWSKPARPSLC